MPCLNTAIVLDCTEICVQKQKCLNERILIYSQYKSAHTLKYLIGIAPSGLITFVSKGYGGKASDKHIFEQTCLIEMLEPHSDFIMTDKGFYIEKNCSKIFIELIKPPYLKQRSQFTQSEAVFCKKKIAHARFNVERSTGRLKTLMILKSVIQYHLLNLMNQIMVIIASVTNSSTSILGDDKF